jgi:hypothetical protein
MMMMTSNSSSSSPWFYTTLPLSISVVIHLLPLHGLLGSPALERLYGFRITTTTKNTNTNTKTNDSNNNDGAVVVSSDDTSSVLLLTLQHRAVMFGSMGIGLFLGTFVHRPSLPTAMGMVGISDVSFLALALPRWKHLNDKMKKVVYADIISVLCLLLALGSQHVN